MKDHWRAVLRIGVKALGLSPAELWAMSLPEWLALVEAEPIAPPSVADMAALRAAFPDHQNEDQA
ncbi:phage tail assembly chaperone [Woodsholea maritima]|uniref:phage tail assembly chaperone n=1 Tax=Woodsholea maritima TaxID=240237 RepID=UPI0003673A50|nr:phage tail assembly chaperone [Woodsholea maritima]